MAIKSIGESCDGFDMKKEARHY
nr:unnamed protein product [Callosobruchus chinensis]CAH7755455.1 unnamed protein product [Callosobruchus chinensis]CAH7755989.1 unnamed protein product [Callosobruchus chinensis]